MYFVKAQIVHEVKCAVDAVMQDKRSQNSCELKDCKSHAYELKDCKYQESCVGFGKHNLSKRNDVVVQPAVEDPVVDDRIPAEAGARMIPAPCEPSEFEKVKHELTHIPFQPWCTSWVTGKAQAEPHKRSVSPKTANFPLFSVSTLFRQMLRLPMD